MTTIGFFNLNSIGMPEMLVVLAIGLLLFGKRLPEVGRGLGKGIVEFKRGLKGMSDEIEAEASRPAVKQSLPESVPAAGAMPVHEDVRVSRSDKIED